MHKQKGLTMISWLVIISFLGLVAISALNIIPSYLNFMSARSVMEDLKSDSSIKGMTTTMIKSTLVARFGSNNLRSINAKQAITFKNRGSAESDGYTVMLDYEDRGKIIGNLYFLTVFHHEVELNP